MLVSRSAYPSARRGRAWYCTVARLAATNTHARRSEMPRAMRNRTAWRWASGFSAFL
jgi:hypothetical protein